MTTNAYEAEIHPKSRHIECGNCRQSLPLRMTECGERAAVWLCAECSVPFVALCIEDRLPGNANSVRLDARYFDTTGLPSISPVIHRHVLALANRKTSSVAQEKRRSTRKAQSLVVPAVCLGPGFVPEGMSFRLIVANLSCEGIGLIHNACIGSEYIALELGTGIEEPIQVIVQIVRQRRLDPPFYEIGGIFYVRMGSEATAPSSTHVPQAE